MNCTQCDDTGSLSKDLHGLLDCGHCDTAIERAALMQQVLTWVHENDPRVCLWLAYKQGKAAAHAQPQ